MFTNTVGETDDFSHLLDIVRENAPSMGIELPEELQKPTLEIINNNVNVTNSNDDIEEIEIIEEDNEVLYTDLTTAIDTDIPVYQPEHNYQKTLKTYNISVGLKLFLDVLNEFNYIYEITSIGFYTFTVVLYFKEVDLHNSTGKSHKLYSSFLKFQIQCNSDRFKFISLHIKRSTFTELEVAHNYTHSHSNGNVFEYGGSCLGGNGIHEKYTKDYNIYFSSPSENDIKLEYVAFLSGLYSWLTWESLEGSPYKHINKLSNPAFISCRTSLDRVVGSSINSHVYDLNYIIPRLYPEILFLFKMIYYILKENHTVIEDNIVFLITDDRIDAELENVLKDVTLKRDVIYYKNDNLDYIHQETYLSSLNIPELQSNEPIKIVSKTPTHDRFKGKIINKIVLESNNIDYSTFRFTVNPNLLNYFKRIIYFNFHKTIIRHELS